MSNKSKKNFPMLNAILGVLALIAIVFLANWFVADSSVGNATLDLTTDRVHTVTGGTKEILKDVKEGEAEVVVSFYASREADYIPRNLTGYIKKVDAFLKRYKSIAGDNLRLEFLDPLPDTDAEDSARLDGMAMQQSASGDGLYCGIAVKCLDEKSVLPFLNPAESERLEYELSSAIAQVSRTDKPTLGIMSPLPVAGVQGNPMMMQQGQRPQPPLVVYQLLQQSYEVEMLTMTPTAEELSDLAAVLLIHPAGITPDTEFVLDQYLLGGGTIVAALDACSILARQLGGGNPMAGQPGMDIVSTFSDELLESWGVTFISNEVVADGVYKTRVSSGRGRPADSPAVLSLTTDAIPKKDNLVTQGLSSISWWLAGAFTFEGKENLKFSSLLNTTNRAGFVESERALSLDPSLMGSFQRGLDEEIEEGDASPIYSLALHVQGVFKTAFPDRVAEAQKSEEADVEGEPAEEASSDDEEETVEVIAGEIEVDTDAATELMNEEATKVLAESERQGNVFLLSDADFISDGFAFQQSIFGFTPVGDNAAFLLNILDQVTGSRHLIGSRARSDSRRPFTVIREMEDKFEESKGEKAAEKEKELNDLMVQLNESAQQQQQSGMAVAEGEMAQKVDDLNEKIVDARREIREMDKELQTKKTTLQNKYFLANLLLVPLGVILIGLLVFVGRRIVTHAR